MNAPTKEPAAQPARTLIDLLAGLIDRDAGPTEVLSFVQVMERQQLREDKQAYVAAMVEFKKKIQSVIKDADAQVDGEQGTEEWSWATLGHICDRILVDLAECGMNHAWSIAQDNTEVAVTTTITHLRGHSESATVRLPRDVGGQRNGCQAIGSSITYGERYSLLAAVGIATKEQQDDDARATFVAPVPVRGARAAVAAPDAGVIHNPGGFAIDGPTLSKALAAIKRHDYTWDDLCSYYSLTDAQMTMAKAELGLK